MALGGEDLYEQHAKSVYRYLFSLCGEADTAEELTQETFYQALKGLHSFRGDCAPQTWLCAIAKRLWYKELSRRGRTVPMEEEALAQVPAPDDPALETEQKDDRLLLYQAIQKLPPDTREVIYLRLAGLYLPGDRDHPEPYRSVGQDAVLPGQGSTDGADGREGT